jgi:hypothetical protein
VANTGLVGFATAVVDGTLMALKRAEPRCGLASDRVAPGPAGVKLIEASHSDSRVKLSTVLVEQEPTHEQTGD